MSRAKTKAKKTPRRLLPPLPVMVEVQANCENCGVGLTQNIGQRSRLPGNASKASPEELCIICAGEGEEEP